MYLTKICGEFHLYLRSLKITLRDTAGTFLLNGWKQIDKGNVETINRATLSEVLKIQAEGFENERQAEIIKHSVKFRETFYIIKIQDRVIGYCTYYLKPVFSHWRFEKESVIYSIAIDREFRNKGFGRKLLEESTREMKLNEVLAVYLYVDVNNIPAIRLYEKVGFHIVKEVENVCGRKKKCYKMELKFV